MRTGGIAITLVGVLAVTACSAATASDEPRTATVAVAVPGGARASGENADVIKAVEAAFDSVAQDSDDEWQIDIKPVDDRKAPEDEDLVAVIGGVSDASVLKLAPALNTSSVLFVSPADGNRVHTRGADPMKAVRPYDSFFTVAHEGDDPLDVLADFGVHGRGIDSFATVTAGGEDAPQAVTDFTLAAEGMDADVPVADKELSADKLQKSDKDVEGVFVTGDAEDAADVAGSARGMDLATLLDPQVDMKKFLEAGGQSVDGVATVTPPTLTSESVARPDALPDTSDLGVAAYDAGIAVATALGNCLPPSDSAVDARKGCLGEMREVAFAGATGEISFNEFGERVGAFADIIVARDEKWKPVSS